MMSKGSVDYPVKGLRDSGYSCFKFDTMNNNVSEKLPMIHFMIIQMYNILCV